MELTSIRRPARSAAPPSARPVARGKTAVPRAVTMIVLIGFAVYFVGPLWWLIVASSKPMGQQFAGNGLWFQGFHLIGNINSLLQAQGGLFVDWMGNSLLYAGVGAIGATLLAGMAGYALAKYRFRGREAVFAVILAAVLIPKMLLTMPLYLFFSDIHLINTRLAVLLPSFVSPFGVYLCRVFASQAVPDELIEAARIDGASEVTIFFRVVARMLGPALVTVFLFNVVDIWNNYLLPVMVINDARLQPVTVGLGGWFASNGKVPMSLVVIGALASLVPLLLVFAFLQRHWKAGLTAGALK